LTHSEKGLQSSKELLSSAAFLPL